MKTLEIGDVLYLCNDLYNSTWYYRYEVESATKTHATLKGEKIKVQIKGNGLGYKVANGNTYYELETPKLKEAYEKQLAVKKLLLAVDTLKNNLGKVCKSLPIDAIKQITQHLNNIIGSE